jgi:hypothetical protein
MKDPVKVKRSNNPKRRHERVQRGFEASETYTQDMLSNCRESSWPDIEEEVNGFRIVRNLALFVRDAQ